MADYYPLIARAVTGLDKSTGEARRALYERARTALVTQLRGVEPALSEADITRERLALEEAIRKVEGEAARRPRQESAEAPANVVPPLPRFDKPSSFAPPPASARSSFRRTFPPPPPPPDWDELHRELDGLAPPPQAESGDAPEPEQETPEPSPHEPSADDPPPPFETESRQEPAPSEPAFPPEAASPPEAAFRPPEPPRQEPFIAPRRFDKKLPGERKSIVDEGLKGFRDVMAETDDLGGATASASKSARETREAFSALPPASDIERIEPRMGPRFGLEDLKPPEQEVPPPPPRGEPRAGGRARPTPPPRPQPEEFDEPEEQRLRSGGVLRKIVSLAVLLLLVGGGRLRLPRMGQQHHRHVPVRQSPGHAGFKRSAAGTAENLRPDRRHAAGHGVAPRARQRGRGGAARRAL